jgi:hypothetical protein
LAFYTEIWLALVPRVAYGLFVLNYWGEGEDIRVVGIEGIAGGPFFMRRADLRPLFLEPPPGSSTIVSIFPSERNSISHSKANGRKPVENFCFAAVRVLSLRVLSSWGEGGDIRVVGIEGIAGGPFFMRLFTSFASRCRFAAINRQ